MIAVRSGMVWAAGGVLLLSVLIVLVLGLTVVDQAESIGALERQGKQLAVDLKSSEAEVHQQHELHMWDQRLFARIDDENKKLRAESEASQRLTRLELQNEECANTPLPESVANRLRDRIHRQARSGAGPPAG